MRKLKPIFIENSKIPIYLSKVAPIEISAITLGFVVIARSKMDQKTKTHETIHFQQYIETLFVGFILLYLYDFIKHYIRLRDGRLAYRSIRAEIEAYDNDSDAFYLLKRKRYDWIFAKKTLKQEKLNS